MKRISIIIALAFIAAMLPAPGWSPLDIDSRTWQRLPAPDQAHVDIRVMMLRATLERMTELPCYRPWWVVTYCNIAAKDALDNRPHPGMSGYGFMLDDLQLDIAAIWPTIWDTWGYSIAQDYRAALRAVHQGRVERVDCRGAYELAKRGEVVFVISMKLNHEAIAWPDLRPWNPDRACTIAQCGAWRAITDISHKWAFGKQWRKADLLFVWLKKRVM